MQFGERGKFWLVLLGSAAALAFMLNLSWLKWTDLLIDSGREIYVPKALADGRLLYRDILYLYGPFSPYFNALLYKVLGVHVLTLAFGGVLNVAAAMFLVYALARDFLDRGLAFFTLLTFLFLFPFGIYSGANIFNYVIPYSYPAVHSLIFSLAGLYYFRKHLTDGAARSWLPVGLFLFLTAITKTEIAAWLAISLFTGLALDRRGRGDRLPSAALKGLKWIAPPLAGGALVVWAFKLAGNGGADPAGLLEVAKSNILMPRDSFAWRLFTGGGNFGASARSVALTALAYAFATTAVLGGGLWYGRSESGKGSKAVPAAAGVCGAVALAVLLTVADLAAHEIFRPLFLVCLAALALAVLGLRGKGHSAEGCFLATLSLFAFLMLLRILFNTGAGSFGFYLAVPGFIVLNLLYLRLLPDLLGKWPGRFAKAAFIAVMVAVTAKFLTLEKAVYARTSNPFPTPRGTLYFWDAARVASYRDLTAVLSRPENRGKTLVVFPEGLWLNFASGLENPLYNYQYLPIDFKSETSFTRLLEDFEAKKPDFFVLADRNVAEYGSSSFDDYSGPLRDYVLAKYELKRSFSGRAVLFQRK